MSKAKIAHSAGVWACPKCGKKLLAVHTDAECIRRAKELMRCETCSGWERKSEVHGRCRRGSEQNTVRRPTDDCVAGWEPKP